MNIDQINIDQLKNDYNIKFKGIGNVYQQTLNTIFNNLSSQQISGLLQNPSFLYFLFFYTPNFNFNNNILSFLFQKVPKNDLKNIISELSNIDLKKIIGKNPKDNILRKSFITLTDEKCSISNFFLQDIFDPQLIFKTKYQPINFDLFFTSFYYLMNCYYNRPNNPFPLQLNVPPTSTTFKFPFDIKLKEWNRPIIMIDVQNVLRTYRTGAAINDRTFIDFFTITGGTKRYNTNNFTDRKQAIVENIVSILTNLFQKHSESNTMVLFITQADTRINKKSINKKSCLNIINFNNTFTKRLLEGTKNNPLNRVALMIETPCNTFAYNLDWLSNNGNITYDEYGSIFTVPPPQPPGNPTPTPYLSYFAPPNIIKRTEDNLDATDINPFISNIRKNSECSSIIGKNELDDYLIGIILLLSFKANNECFKLKLQYKPIVFTNDNYNWMESELKNYFIRPRFDFFDYIYTNQYPNIKNYSIQNNTFWDQFDKTYFNRDQLKDIYKIVQENLKRLPPPV